MKLSGDSVYRKTALGVAALKTRGGPLTGAGRTALILINGREPLAALAGKIGPDALRLAEMLLAMALIEEVRAEPAAVPPKRPPGAAPSSPAAPAARLQALKREALARLAPQFGPDVDIVCAPLLAAGTEAACRDALAAVESKLAIYVGRKAARRMLDGLLP